ncbi:hypothetical protein C3F09_01185 [candidate division GN15 bacterium]|uniref:Peptidase S74 domain-containing protein n=1 Tax=candidate division GN15 bacterium TaxID=2072418 RepID=A0A855X489_9BACT|nr:MAG: hypothetical protein C3F09_01185 [candidate division GN15 bacterium]
MFVQFMQKPYAALLSLERVFLNCQCQKLTPPIDSLPTLHRYCCFRFDRINTIRALTTTLNGRSNMLTKASAFVLFMALFIGAKGTASPQLIDYQGFLKNSGGNPVTGTVNITFTIYTASSGGSSKWSETQNNVSVVGGLFNVTLGTSTAIPDTVFNQSDRWLAVSIGGTELSPRTRVSASAYSMRVNTVDGASGGTINGDLNAGKGNFGISNNNEGSYSFVAGEQCQAKGDHATVSGGKYNRAWGTFSTVGGGGGANAADSNAANGSYSTVGGGISNSSTANHAFVGGGKGNSASGNEAVVAGGWYCTAGYAQAAVGGGYKNSANAVGATIPGGFADTASGASSTIGGGSFNLASGFNSTIPGGRSNRATGSLSLASGYRAQADHAGAFVWSDSTEADFSSSAINQFNVRSTGGVRIYTNSALTAGVTLAAGASAWQSVSDSTLKQNIRVVDGRDILSRLMQLPIKQWSYKAQSPDIEHIGPMAQDFYAIFKLGDDDKTISTIDPAGIALAAIQELYRTQQSLQQKTAEIDNLKTELAELKSAVSQILAAKGNSVSSGDLASTPSSATTRPLNSR